MQLLILEQALPVNTPTSIQYRWWKELGYMVSHPEQSFGLDILLFWKDVFRTQENYEKEQLDVGSEHPLNLHVRNT